MRLLKNGEIQVLVATDVASRGLDVDDLSHVFNFHLPDNRDRYTNRIGRTGRADKKGLAITLATPFELHSHEFFQQSAKVRDFKLEDLPSKSQVIRRHEQDLMEKLTAIVVTEEMRSKCAALFANAEPLDAMAQMFKLLQTERGIQGPEHLGFHPSKVQEMAGVGKRGFSQDFGGRKWRPRNGFRARNERTRRTSGRRRANSE